MTTKKSKDSASAVHKYRLLQAQTVMYPGATMKRVGLVVMAMLLLLAGTRANAGNIDGGCTPPCGQCQACFGGGLGGFCLPQIGSPCIVGSSAGVCDFSGCVAFTATPTVTNTATATPTETPTPTPTATNTPTPHNLPDTDPCNDSRQCASALCNGGVCATANPAPAVSNHTAVFIGAALLLAGLWSVRRVARRR